MTISAIMGNGCMPLWDLSVSETVSNVAVETHSRVTVSVALGALEVQVYML